MIVSVGFLIIVQARPEIEHEGAGLYASSCGVLRIINCQCLVYEYCHSRLAFSLAARP
jgi:hypothetical protein